MPPHVREALALEEAGDGGTPKSPTPLECPLEVRDAYFLLMVDILNSAGAMYNNSMMLRWVRSVCVGWPQCLIESRMV